MEPDTTKQETTSKEPGKGRRVAKTVLAVFTGIFMCFNHLSSLWIKAGTSYSPRIVNTEVNPKWKDVSKYGMSDDVAYYFDPSPIPIEKECFAIDLYLRGFKEKKHNVYEVGCYMVFPNYPDSIVRGNRLVVYLHNGDSAVAKAYVNAFPKPIRRTYRRQTRSLKAERYCCYSISKKNFFKLLQTRPDSIKVESANGQIVRPASRKANMRLQKRYFMLEEYLNKFQYKMKERNQETADKNTTS